MRTARPERDALDADMGEAEPGRRSSSHETEQEELEAEQRGSPVPRPGGEDSQQEERHQEASRGERHGGVGVQKPTGPAGISDKGAGESEEQLPGVGRGARQRNARVREQRERSSSVPLRDRERCEEHQRRRRRQKSLHEAWTADDEPHEPDNRQGHGQERRRCDRDGRE
ncbi:hypothetical protein ACFPRL_11240 [Pseudoclavibacter helvolus]